MVLPLPLRIFAPRVLSGFTGVIANVGGCQGQLVLRLLQEVFDYWDHPCSEDMAKWLAFGIAARRFLDLDIWSHTFTVFSRGRGM
jgi:hypothetical protein